MRGMKPAAASRLLIYGQLRQSRTANVTNNHGGRLNGALRLAQARVTSSPMPKCRADADNRRFLGRVRERARQPPPQGERRDRSGQAAGHHPVPRRQAEAPQRRAHAVPERRRLQLFPLPEVRHARKRPLPRRRRAAMREMLRHNGHCVSHPNGLRQPARTPAPKGPSSQPARRETRNQQAATV
jgi:hypothetical protein